MLYNELFANEFDTQIIRKKLAKEIGLNEAIVLNQLHYWIEKNKRAGNNYYDGRYWVYNTYEDWQKQDFEYWSVKTIQRIFSKLESIGLVISGNYNKMPMDRTKWYTIDYDKLEKLAENIEKSTIRTNCPNAKGQSDLSNNHRITTKNNSVNSSTELNDNDFDFEILQKANKLTDDETVIEAIQYYLDKYKRFTGKNHPNVSKLALNVIIDNIQEVLQDEWDDVVNEDGLERMISRHFKTNYGQNIDYNIVHFGTEKILEYQARNVGLITGLRD